MKDSTAHKFNQAAERQDPAAFDYAREVENVWRDFPEKKDCVHFLDLCAPELLVRPGSEAAKTAEIKARLLTKNLRENITTMTFTEESSCYYTVSGALLLYTKKHKFSFLDRAATQAQETMLIFDHELAHAIIPNAGYAGGSNKAECIADGYATIRHLQRYGADSPVIDAIVQQRAFQFIFRRARASHYSSPVTAQILARRHAIDWDSLTPSQTTELAWRFTMTYAMYPILLDTLDREFSFFHGRIDELKNGTTASLEKLAEKVLSSPSPEIFRCGADALQLCLDGQVAGIALTGDYWNDVRGQLATRRKTLEAEGDLVFGLGMPPQPGPMNNVIKFPGRGL